MSTTFEQIEQNFKPSSDGKCVESLQGMVSTQSAQASEAGLMMLKKGGNAVDAAVAAAIALGVSEPQASGLGGQTMMLIGNQQKVIAIDGSSRAPSLAHVSAIYKKDRSLGYRASTVPSTLATLAYTQEKYGKLRWDETIEPSIRLAEEGFTITELQNRLQIRELESFRQIDSNSGGNYFLKEGKNPYEPGEIFKQPDLAKTLQRIAAKGVLEFYQGKIAKQIDADMRENGGLLRFDDLALVPWPIERKPLTTKFRGCSVYTMPPPGAGRMLVFSLMMLNYIPKKLKFKEEFTKNLLLLKILRKAFLERSDRPFDPNFFPQVSDKKGMLSPKYAHSCLKEIIQEVDKEILSSIASEDELSGETTHLSVMDNQGMAVTLTQSIERVYGSKSAAEGLGFLYNNYLYDFDYKFPQHPFYLRPNAVPWATVAPTLLFKNKQIWMALGSPGSERIVSVLSHFLSRILDLGCSMDEAMKAPRIHCSLGGRVSYEKERFPENFGSFLKEKGFRLDPREPYAFYLGCIQAVLKKENNQGFQGVADIRRDGKVAGY